MKELGKLTPEIVTEGYRKKKNWFSPGITTANMNPKVHARNVATGMSASVLLTADRTSG